MPPALACPSYTIKSRTVGGCRIGARSRTLANGTPWVALAEPTADCSRVSGSFGRSSRARISRRPPCSPSNVATSTTRSATITPARGPFPVSYVHSFIAVPFLASQASGGPEKFAEVTVVRDYALGLAHVNGGLGAIGGRHGSDGVLVVPVARPRIRRGLAQQAVPQSAIEAALVQIVFDREVLSGHDLLPVSRIMAWPGKGESMLGLRQAVQRRSRWQRQLGSPQYLGNQGGLGPRTRRQLAHLGLVPAGCREAVVRRYLPGKRGEVRSRGQGQTQQAYLGQLQHVLVSTAAGVQRVRRRGQRIAARSGVRPGVALPIDHIEPQAILAQTDRVGKPVGRRPSTWLGPSPASNPRRITATAFVPPLVTYRVRSSGDNARLFGLLPFRPWRPGQSSGGLSSSSIPPVTPCRLARWPCRETAPPRAAPCGECQGWS